MDGKIEAGNTASFSLNPLCADDLWDLGALIKKLGVTEAMQALPKKELTKLQNYKAPTMLDDSGNVVPMPRDKWNDRQIKAEEDAEIAQSMVIGKFIGCIVDHIFECKDEVNRLLARGIGEDLTALSKMPIADYVQLIYAYFDRDEMIDFFRQALKSAPTQMKSRTSYTAGMAAQ